MAWGIAAIPYSLFPIPKKLRDLRVLRGYIGFKTKM